MLVPVGGVVASSLPWTRTYVIRVSERAGRVALKLAHFGLSEP